MKKAPIPNESDLPSARELGRSTLVALAVAALLLATVVLPAEYGIDPTGIGRPLGLTRMGEIKVALRNEAAADAASKVAAAERAAAVERVASSENGSASTLADGTGATGTPSGGTASTAGLTALAGSAPAHLELLSSDPQKDQTIARPPIDIALVFSESVDSARTVVTLDGPNGKVELGPVRLADEALVVMTKVAGPMSAGAYTVSWTAAAPEMDPVKGSFRFTVRQER